MSMGDVKRFRKEVVDSIGTGTASPVRAVFSSAIADGDTFLMGEMAGVNEGLVIQELSRADELVKLQHELEKQVGKLAELGELKWLGELEKLQAEEIQKVKGRIGEMETKKLKEVERAKGEVETIGGLKQEIEEKKQEIEKLVKEKKEIDNLDKLVKKLEEVEKAKEEAKGLEVKKTEELKKLQTKVKEVEKQLEMIKGLQKEVEDLKGQEARTSLEQLEARKIAEVKTATDDAVKKIGLKGIEHSWGKKLTVEEVKEAGNAGALAKKLGQLRLDSSPGLVKEVEDLRSKLEALAAIRELKALGLEERLRELAEVKEVKALAARQKAGELDAQEGLQLTEKIRALSVGMVGRLEARRLGEEGGLEEVWILGKLGQLDALASGERSQALVEVKAALKRLKEMKIREARKEVVTTLGLNEEEIKKVKDKIEAAKKKWEIQEVKTAMGATAEKVIAELEEQLEGLKSLGEQELVKMTAEEVEAKVKEVRELVQLEEVKPEKNHWFKHLQKTEVKDLKIKLEEALKNEVKTKEKTKNLKNKLKELAKIKALEELTEIAEKRGVATVMKAALTSAMEITKNRGWTDYLNGVDAEARSNLLAYSPHATTQASYSLALLALPAFLVLH